MPRTFRGWEKLVADKKVDVDRVPGVRYDRPGRRLQWSIHADMPTALREKLAQALLSLDRSTPEGKEVLDLQRATKFIPSSVDNYKGIEAAARSANLL